MYDQFKCYLQTTALFITLHFKILESKYLITERYKLKNSAYWSWWTYACCLTWRSPGVSRSLISNDSNPILRDYQLSAIRNEKRIPTPVYRQDFQYPPEYPDRQSCSRQRLLGNRVLAFLAWTGFSGLGHTLRFEVWEGLQVYRGLPKALCLGARILQSESCLFTMGGAISFII